jgi:hypothetical protein
MSFQNLNINQHFWLERPAKCFSHSSEDEFIYKINGMSSIRRTELAETGLTPSTKTYVTALLHNLSKWIGFNVFCNHCLLSCFIESPFFPCNYTTGSFHNFVFMFEHVKCLVMCKILFLVQLILAFFLLLPLAWF